MGFVERAFTPPGSGAYVPPPGSPPVAAAAAAPPTPPTAPTMPKAPQTFNPATAASASQRSVISSGGASLGAGAAAGQTTKKTLLGG